MGERAAAAGHPDRRSPREPARKRVRGRHGSSGWGEAPLATGQRSGGREEPSARSPSRDAGTRGLVGGCELRIQSMALRTSRTGPAASTEGTATRAGRWLCHAAMRSRLAQVAEDNNASRRVAERAGFTKQETFTGEDGQPMVRYIHAAPRI